MEQLAAGHIEPSNSPWNIPVFVIKKKSGKWRVLQDLRAINTTMEDMGAFQLGLPSPVSVPFQYNVIVIDLQDYFITIPLAVQDCKRFAFSLPSANFKQPYQIRSDQIRSVAQSCPTLCDPMNRSTPALPVHHQLPEFTQTHIHRVSDTIQPSHPLSSPSRLAPNPSQHQSLFQ